MQPTTLIRCERAHLEARCVERGYTLSEVMPCVVSQDGEHWTVDVGHDAYPSVSRIASKETPGSGPGTELKRLLSAAGISASPGCACLARAAEMDRQGVEWCEQNTDLIVGWLREQAAARGLPFLDVAGRLLVRRAIRNARKAAAGKI